MYETVELKHGGAVLVRPLAPRDRARYVEAVNALSPRSRYLRFAAPVRTLSERTVDRMMDADGERHVALVALDAHAIVAVGRYVITRPWVGELALAVADAWQRHGLGRALVDRLAARARAVGLCRLEAATLAENEPSRRLLEGAGFVLCSSAGRMVDYRLDLAPLR